MARLDLNLITLAVAVSYLTLGVAAPERAGRLWALYAAVTFALSLVNVVRNR